MNTVSPDVPAKRIVVFGIQCAFTNRVVEHLTARKLPPIALILPGHPEIDQPLRMPSPSSAVPLLGVTTPVTPYPTYRVGQLNAPATQELVESLRPDYIVVACYPQLIPRALRQIPSIMSLNVHPSLLPEHRGPDPLFWIMRAGGAGCGVTVHELSGRFDAGRIIARQVVPYPNGARESEVESLLAGVGAGLVGDIIETGSMTLTVTLSSPRRESYESWPTDDDYVVPVSVPVLTAWNFIRGVAERGIPVRVVSDTGVIHVTDTVAYGLTAQPPESPEQNEVVCCFADGWLKAIALEANAG